MMQTSQPIAALADRDALIAAYEELRPVNLTVFLGRAKRPPIRCPKLLSSSAHCCASVVVVPVSAMTATFIL